MKFIAEIISIKQETHDVKTFRFNKPNEFSFISGQYCLVSFVDQDGGRPFTFSNNPTSDYIELTIKKIGEFTKELFKLKVGNKLVIDGPKESVLRFDGSIKDNIVFLAGGSGITPFMSIIRYIVNKRLHNKIILLYSNRTTKDIIYKKELDKIDSIDVIYFITNEIVKNLRYESRRVDKELVRKHVKDVNDYLWYICGPPRMVDAMKNILNELSVDKEKIKAAEWQIPGKN